MKAPGLPEGATAGDSASMRGFKPGRRTPFVSAISWLVRHRSQMTWLHWEGGTTGRRVKYQALLL